MANIKTPSDLILPIPENNKDQELNKTLQDWSKTVNDTFSALEDVTNKVAGDGLTDASDTFSVNVDDVTIQINVSDELEVIPGGISHDDLADTHNLTTDIDHDGLTNFTQDEHFTMIDDDSFATASSTTAATSESIKEYVDTQISGINSSIEIFTSSGSWTAPTGITKIFLTMVGGGGAGGGATYEGGNTGSGGGGGAGEGVLMRPYTVTPGNSYSYTVGSGGSGSSGGDGGSGTATSFDSGALSCAGGAGGLVGSTTQGNGGIGGGNSATPTYYLDASASTSTASATSSSGFRGGNGAAAVSNTSSGAGGSSIFAKGANGVGAQTTGLSGTLGSGGSGAGGNGTPADNRFGGAGGAGVILLEY